MCYIYYTNDSTIKIKDVLYILVSDVLYIYIYTND